MENYCVWKDNLLEEFFCLKEKEFEMYPNLKKVLKIEKNTIYTILAESITDAVQQHKEQINQPVSKIKLH